MMSCYEATRLLSESQDRQLQLKERLGLRVHTTMCSACRHFGKQMTIIRLAMRRDAAGERTDKQD